MNSSHPHSPTPRPVPGWPRLACVLFAGLVLLLAALILTAPAAPAESSPPLQGVRRTPTDTRTPRPQPMCIWNDHRVTCTPTRTRVPPSPTPSRTYTPAPPKEPKDTPWPTDTPTDTSTPVQVITLGLPLRRPNTLTPTAAPSLTATGTPTAPPTASPTLTSAPTAAPTLAPTLTPTRPPASGAHVVISEFRTNGPNGPNDQFVELYNPGPLPVDLTGWQLKASDAAPTPQITTLVTISKTLLAPGWHWLATYAGQSGFSGRVTPDQTFSERIPDDGGLALTTGDDGLVDAVGLSAGSAFKAGAPLSPLTGRADRSYERKLGGPAGSCVNSGDNLNDFQVRAPSEPQALANLPNPCGGTATPTPAGITTSVGGARVTGLGGLSFTSTYFVDTIRGAQAVGATSLETLVRNLLLAILLALIFGFFGLLLYDTLEAHEQDLRGLLGPLRGLLQLGAGGLKQASAALARLHLGWLSDVLQFLAALLVFGLIYSFVDPSFSLTRDDAPASILLMALSVGLVNLFDDLARLWYVRRRGGQAAVRVHPGNLLLGGLLVFVSRLGAISPGIMSVGVGGLEGDEKGPPETVALVGASGYAVPAFAAWLLLGAASFWPAGDLSLFIASVLALIFAIGLQTVFFEMIPAPGFYGHAIFKRNRPLWFALTTLFTFAFLQTQLDPTGTFVSPFDKPNMAALAVFVLGFCLISGGVWLYFRRRDRLASR